MKPRPAEGTGPTPGLSKGALQRPKTEVDESFPKTKLSFLCTHDLAGTLLPINDACLPGPGLRSIRAPRRQHRNILASEYRDQFDGYLDRTPFLRGSDGVMTVVTRDGAKRLWHYQNILRLEADPITIVARRPRST